MNNRYTFRLIENGKVTKSLEVIEKTDASKTTKTKRWIVNPDDDPPVACVLKAA